MKLIYRLRKYIFRCLVVLAVLVSAAGCGNDAASLDRQEENDPALRRARVKKKSQDIDGAIALYNKALERKPQLGRAHLEVGLLYDSYKEDYNRAIYHYQRYLELRPNSEKKQLIQDLIRRARISYAASLPDTPSGAIEEIQALREENESLKGRLASLMERYNALASGPSRGSQPVAASARPAASAPMQPAPAPAQPSVRTYRVQRGDTLSSIAKRMYSDSSSWKKIYEANRNILESPRDLDVGQTLVIP
jgi:tetratricopeptide (TPR) repeat protein